MLHYCPSVAARHLSSYFDQGTLTSHLSVNEHVRDVICRCAQSMYAIKVLQTHGMSDEDLRIIYKAVVLAKIMYASPAWWGFADNGSRHSFVVESGLGFTKLMTQHQLNFLLTATTTCLSVYCQTVTTFSATY